VRRSALVHELALSLSSLPSIDALIVSFNTREDLGVTLKSLLDYQPVEAALRVTVLDNASSDGSADMVERQFPDVTLVRGRENIGFGRANNILAERSSAAYLLLLNSDTVLAGDIITPLLRTLQDDPTAVLVGPRMVYPDGRVQYSAQRLPTLSYEFARVLRGKRLGRLLAPAFDSQRIVDSTDEVDLTNRRVARETQFVWATCWLLRRADIQREGLFDASFPMYDEDLDFCRRAIARGRTVRYVPDSELVHVGGASTNSTKAKQTLMVRARKRYYLVHHGRRTATAYALLVPLVARVADFVEATPRPRFGAVRAKA
jgi:N-acetylglucosaminyl-diphospho-decaprenol L-rhamnosyltransferase